MDRLWNCYREQKVLSPLIEAFRVGRIHHGYVFSGVPGLGKRAILLGLAAQLLYPSLTPDEEREVIDRLQRGAEADVLFLWDNGTTLKIEEMRELQRKLAQTATGKWRIVCIERIERMTIEAANAFLKTLEEPGQRTVFLMTTDYYEELLPTIVSRAQVVTLQPLPERIFRQYVSEIASVDGEEVYMLSHGRADIARQLLEDGDLLSRYREMNQAVQVVFGQTPLEEKIPIIERVSTEKEDVLLFLELSSYYLRDRMQEAVHTGRSISSDVLRKASYLTTARQEILQNVNKRLVLEHFLFLV